MTASTVQSTSSSSGSVPAVTSNSAIFRAFPSCLAVYAPLRTVSKREWNTSLNMHLAEDFILLKQKKQHKKIVNEILTPDLPEDVVESVWGCFKGDIKSSDDVPVKKEIEIQRQADKKKNPSVTDVPIKKQFNCQKNTTNMDKKKNQMVTLKLITPSSISIRAYPIFPSSNTNKDAAHCSTTSSPSPFTIDTSVPPPSFLTPPTSGPASPTTTTKSPSFAFNMGVVNAPTAGVKVAKRDLSGSGDAFEMIIDHSKPKKVKIFSPEEVKKQESLVDEWKRKILESQ
ncbi:hypothetical protein GCK72_003283 [Caenorhabditis remanei]|uniref:Uncharacterized protein n=1 Tax=Caenorhabditis remanei TaxID=31234 RepID=A0A6A5HXY5_CAERE|nr:hypothetical protein GCK72_003283 [Caenorhabditis remanei]KAF1771457.1 hypothetical protein GCK72_003283 [Caenorhabditis remanei]